MDLHENAWTRGSWHWRNSDTRLIDLGLSTVGIAYSAFWCGSDIGHTPVWRYIALQSDFLVFAYTTVVQEDISFSNSAFALVICLFIVL